jgi:hypothetical protein
MTGWQSAVNPMVRREDARRSTGKKSSSFSMMILTQLAHNLKAVSDLSEESRRLACSYPYRSDGAESDLNGSKSVHWLLVFCCSSHSCHCSYHQSPVGHQRLHSSSRTARNNANPSRFLLLECATYRACFTSCMTSACFSSGSEPRPEWWGHSSLNSCRSLVRLEGKSVPFSVA